MYVPKVVVVEPNLRAHAAWRAAFRRMFGADCTDVYSCESVFAANLLAFFPGAPDLVVLDQTMTFDGLEVMPAHVDPADPITVPVIRAVLFARRICSAAPIIVHARSPQAFDLNFGRALTEINQCPRLFRVVHKNGNYEELVTVARAMLSNTLHEAVAAS